MDVWKLNLYKEYITLASSKILPKSSCLGALVLKSGFFRFYAPLPIPSKRNVI